MGAKRMVLLQMDGGTSKEGSLLKKNNSILYEESIFYFLNFLYPIKICKWYIFEGAVSLYIPGSY